MNLHLPPPWGAPERDLRCERCEQTTLHYGRQITAVADDESDRATGEVAWFCTVCGHRHDVIERPLPGQATPDDLSELFDRH